MRGISFTLFLCLLSAARADEVANGPTFLVQGSANGQTPSEPKGAKPAPQPEPIDEKPAPQPLAPAVGFAQSAALWQQNNLIATPGGFPYAIKLEGFGFRPSPQQYDPWTTGRQLAAPRPFNTYLGTEIKGLTVIPAGLNGSWIVPEGTARVDAFRDSTHLSGSPNLNFQTKSILVPGQDFFNAPGESSVVGSRTTLNLTGFIPTSIGTVKTFYQNTFIDSQTGKSAYYLQHLYAQATSPAGSATAVAGVTFSFFTDVDARPDTFNPAGPTGAMDNSDFQGTTSRPLMGVYLPLFGTDSPYTMAFAVERPDVSVTMPDGFISVARFPDLVGTMRYQTPELGHIQFGALCRSIGIENPTNTNHQSVFSWGTQVSTQLFPFRSLHCLQDNYFSAAATYGEGIGSYNPDLSDGKNDAVLDADGKLKALPMWGYYIGYTHFWTEHLRSVFVYSELQLDSVAAQGGFAFRHSRYASANIAYQWTSTVAGRPAFIRFGLEYIYGQKETFNGAVGDDHRVMATLWVK